MIKCYKKCFASIFVYNDVYFVNFFILNVN